MQFQATLSLLKRVWVLLQRNDSIEADLMTIEMAGINSAQPNDGATKTSLANLSDFEVERNEKDEITKSARILVVDNEPLNIQLAVKYLQLAGFQNFVTTVDAQEVVELVEQHRPDLLLLDILMPQISGLQILEQLRKSPRWFNLPIVVLTADDSQTTKRKALQLGANDFLRKPVDPIEMMPRIRNVVKVKKQYDLLHRYAKELEEQVQIKTAELVRSHREISQCLARAAEYRDDDSGRHVIRVGRYCRLIGQQLGIEDHQLDVFEQAAQLHDIGKIAIPESILLKRAKLTAEEMHVVVRHTEIGKNILEMPNEDQLLLQDHTVRGSRLLSKSESPILQLAATISLTHHECWDGSGYPNHLSGNDIPLEGRIVAVADVFDALSSERPYKKAYPIEECFRILEDGRGKQFDPAVLDAFFRARQDILFTFVCYSDQI